MLRNSEQKVRNDAITLGLSGRYREYEYYEGTFTDKFARSVSGRVVVDCGMCYGYYTAIALWAGCQSVFGFEADSDRHGSHLREVFGEKKNVTMRFCAVGDTVGPIELVAQPDSLRSWCATEAISVQRGGKKTTRVKVQCDTIDNAVEGPVGVIKCDTEGGEATIFHGAQRVLREYHPVIFLELHKIGRAAKAELQKLFRRFDYPAEFMKSNTNRHVLEARA